MPFNEAILRERYKIIREISRGGMGVVYLAKDLLTNQPVAVKKSFFAGDSSARRGFETEAKLLARLKHEGLPKVLDYFVLESSFQALVMDYVEGETLADVLESGKNRSGRGLNSTLVLDWALQILNILKYLHNFEPPVVHRDIKPNNIKINPEGKIILLDFGLAKGSAVTMIGGMSGYSPIEQVNRTGTDPRSDIYALGTTLFHLLTDDYPLTALDRFRSVYGQKITAIEEIGETTVQRTLAEINPQISPEISEIVMKAMALMPEDRFQTVEEMKFELVRYIRENNSSSSDLLINTVKYDEKIPSLFDDDEEFTESSESLYQPAESSSEKSGFFEDQPAQKVGSDLTIASASSFRNKIEIGNYGNTKYENTLIPEFKGGSDSFPDTAPLSPKNSLLKRKKKSLVAALGVFAIVLLCGFGFLAWYLIIPANPKQSSSVSTDNIVAVTAKDNQTNPLQVSIFRPARNGEKTILSDDYLFPEREKFKFLIKSPQAGFLYIISLDDQSKASLAYPKPAQKNNLQTNSETIFPADTTFEFTPETANEIRIYFIVVPTREDDLAKRITTTFEYEIDKRVVAADKTGELIEQLDKIAEDSAETNRKTADSQNNSLVIVKKIKKRV